MTGTKEPTAATAQANEAALARYAMDDREDFALADRGLVAEITETVRDDGEVVFDASHLAYISDDAPHPPSVNPSLWRQSQLIKRAGLYRVVDGLYQVRNNAGANITFVDAPDGVVVIDASEAVESAAQALALFREHVNDKPVVGVIYTHTHFDHYGGVKGVVSEDDVTSGRVPIVAPGTLASFAKFAIGENVIAGNAMSRRASYAFATLLPQSRYGLVTGGIGPSGNKNFSVSYLSPTDPVTKTGQTLTLGGWEFEFLYAPDTEAPEEMHIWIPAIKALTCAENANHTMHNIQTLRGARTRDARNFARYLDETLVRWGDDVEVHYGPHTWPVWGNAEVVELLESQRDLYKYIHDQSLRLANQGYTPVEAAEVIELPPVLGRRWSNRYYHGALHHNVRAVFAKELGFWDGDPASLWPLVPTEYAKRHVALVGREKLLEEGRRAIDAADYRWAVQVLHHLVFADPDDAEAKGLQADAYEQLGYQQEIPQWRGIFLTAAQELRGGVSTEGALATASPDTILAMPVDLLFDFAAVHVDGVKAAEVEVRIDLTFTDTGDEWTLWVRNGVLNARPAHSGAAQLTVSGPKAALVGFLLQPGTALALVDSGAVTADGDRTAIATLASVMEEFDPAFPLVTP
ncbi:alkyl/aryl-sulfatase [Luteimicrobium sp. DT211]|uniref:alkyl/aryl-sulfatase n=1 Tax=Luteimicrobium sp. DT211 TaxID=3393412 RepID=UPI003CF1E447